MTSAGNMSLNNPTSGRVEPFHYSLASIPTTTCERGLLGTQDRHK